jgi:hypothetical protein
MRYYLMTKNVNNMISLDTALMEEVWEEAQALDFMEAGSPVDSILMTSLVSSLVEALVVLLLEVIRLVDLQPAMIFRFL